MAFGRAALSLLLLFALAVDFFLRRLQSVIPSQVTKAFADDIGAVLPNFKSHGTLLMTQFIGFARISGLYLNLPKTVLIPLWKFDPAVHTSLLERLYPLWAGCVLATHGRYLGFQEGPFTASTSWDLPLAKFRERGPLWGAAQLSLQFAARVFNAFLFTVLCLAPN